MKKIMHQRGNLSFVLTITFLLIVLTACQKDEIKQQFQNDSLPREEQVYAKTTDHIIWQDNADGSSLFSSYINKQTSTSYGITASSIYAFNGTKSARFELRDTDPENHSGTRAEICFPTPASANLWYSYALLVPTGQYKPEADDEVITQWHGGGGVTPAICLRTKSDRLYLRIVGDIWIDLGTLDKDKWHTYIMHIRHSSGSDGLIEMWRDGQKIVNRPGKNMYSLSLGSDYHLPQWKLGLYKSDWNGSHTTSTNLRVLYFDDIKFGNSDATYQEMLPTGNNVPVPTALSIQSLILVNSATEKDVTTISDGQKISLGTLNLSKVNIRAAVTGNTGSVKFELSGKQNKTFVDNKAPYALHGDDGNGNFYYDNWNPPTSGTYTLKATPYSQADQKGTAGASKKVTFTIAK